MTLARWSAGRFPRRATHPPTGGLRRAASGGLTSRRNREALGQIDAIVGCGDLEPEYLDFLADAFRAPLLYVRGNHDRGRELAGGPRRASGAAAATSRGARRTVAGRSVVAQRPSRSSRPRRDRRPGDRCSDSASPAETTDRWSSSATSRHTAWATLQRTSTTAALRPITGYAGASTRSSGCTATPRSRQATEWLATWGGTTLVNVTGAVVVEIGARPEARPLTSGDRPPSEEE